MTEPSTEPAPQEPNSNAKPATEKPERTFTQAEVDALIDRRFAKERSKFADYDDLKAKAAELDQVRDASKSELERAVDNARKEGAKTATQAANLRLVKAEARALAASNRFRDPSDAVAFLGDLSGVKVSADGDVDLDSLKGALAELAESKPYLLVEEKPTRPSGDVGQGPRGDGPVSGGEAMNTWIRQAAGRT